MLTYQLYSWYEFDWGRRRDWDELGAWTVQMAVKSFSSSSLKKHIYSSFFLRLSPIINAYAPIGTTFMVYTLSCNLVILNCF